MSEYLSALAGVAARAPAPSAPTSDGGLLDSFRDLWSDNALVIGERVGLALLIFVGGWLVAKFVSWLVYRMLMATDLDNKLADKLRLSLLVDGDPKATAKDAKQVTNQLERFVANTVYYMLMLLVLVGVLQYAGLSQAATPIQGLVETVVQALPLVGKAVILLIVAYFAGTILSKLVSRGLDLLRVDNRFAELSAAPAAGAQQQRPFSQAAGNAVFWLVMVVGLAGAFDALKIASISGPLNNALDRVVGLVPKLAIGAVIFTVGYVLGRITRVIVHNLLDALGFNKLIDRLGMTGLFGGKKPSGIVGLALMAFIMLQASIAALNELGLITIAGPLTDMMARFWLVLPNLAVSALVVVVGVFIGRLLRGVVAGALRGLGFDALMYRLGFPKLEDRSDRLGEPSELFGFAIQLAVVMLAAAQACENLQLATWASYINLFLGYLLRHVLVAVAIVGVGQAIGGYVRDLIAAKAAEGEAQTGNARWVGEFARYAVLVFAFTMAVHQLGVAEDFVLMSFGLLFGALCLAAALAFGLGSRDVAGEIVRKRYQQIQQPPGAPQAPAQRGPSGPTSASSGFFNRPQQP
jgi:hypothetical protein